MIIIKAKDETLHITEKDAYSSCSFSFLFTNIAEVEMDYFDASLTDGFVAIRLREGVFTGGQPTRFEWEVDDGSTDALLKMQLKLVDLCVKHRIPVKVCRQMEENFEGFVNWHRQNEVEEEWNDELMYRKVFSRN